MNRPNRTNGLIAFVLSIVVIVVMLCAGVSSVVMVKALDGTPNQNVSDRVSNVSINIMDTDTGNDCVTNNTYVAPLISGRNYTMELSWEIAEDRYNSHIEVGDYFEFDISDGYFSFANSVSDNDLIYGGKTIGTWKIQDNKIICTFSDDCEDFIRVSGFFEISGSLYTSARDEQTVTLAGVDLDVVMNPVLSGFPYSGAPTVTWPGGIISKQGVYDRGSDFMNWGIYVNYENGVKKVLGDDTYRDVDDVVIKDVLPNDLVLDRVLITTPINHPKDETTLSTQASFKLNLNDNFTVKNESEFANSAEWESYINHNELTYGVSNDNKTIIINLGDLPGSMTMASDRAGLINKLSAGDVNLTTEEKNALADIYYDTTTGTYPVISVYIDLKVRSGSITGGFQQEFYTNTVSLTATGVVETEASNQLQVESANAGIAGSTPGTATLIKKDYTSGTVIPGASFKLQKHNGLEWTDYTPVTGNAIRVTDNAGKITYENLGTGRYRFVETEAAPTYDIDSVIYSASEFTVSNGDTSGHEIIATNEKISVTPPPTTEAPTTEAPTTEAPTTEAPTTETPTTEAPTTEAPTTEAPTTEVPTTEASTTETPTTEESTTDAPGADKPTGEESTEDDTEVEPPVNAGDRARIKMWTVLTVSTLVIGLITLIVGRKRNMTEE